MQCPVPRRKDPFGAMTLCRVTSRKKSHVVVFRQSECGEHHPPMHPQAHKHRQTARGPRHAMPSSKRRRSCLIEALTHEQVPSFRILHLSFILTTTINSLHTTPTRLTMIANRFLSVGLVALCLVLAAGTQPARADWIQDATAGGQRVFQAAFDSWTE